MKEHILTISSIQHTLIDASTLPVATRLPSNEKAAARHLSLCEVTYAVSYIAGSGALVWGSVSYSRSRPGPRVYSRRLRGLSTSENH